MDIEISCAGDDVQPVPMEEGEKKITVAAASPPTAQQIITENAKEIHEAALPVVRKLLVEWSRCRPTAPLDFTMQTLALYTPPTETDAEVQKLLTPEFHTYLKEYSLLDLLDDMIRAALENGKSTDVPLFLMSYLRWNKKNFVLKNSKLAGGDKQ